MSFDGVLRGLAQLREGEYGMQPIAAMAKINELSIQLEKVRTEALEALEKSREAFDYLVDHSLIDFHGIAEEEHDDNPEDCNCPEVKLVNEAYRQLEEVLRNERRR